MMGVDMPKKVGKGKRMVTTNIKVTSETHKEVQVASKLLSKSQSEVISEALRLLIPNLSEDVRRLEELERAASERAEEAIRSRKN